MSEVGLQLGARSAQFLSAKPQGESAITYRLRRGSQRRFCQKKIAFSAWWYLSPIPSRQKLCLEPSSTGFITRPSMAGCFFWGRWRMAPISRAEKASARPGTYETSAGAGAPWEMTGPPAAKSIPVEAPVGAVGELVRRGLDVVAPGLAAIAAACAPQRGDVRLLRLAWSYFSENRCSCCRRILKVPNLHGHRDIPVFVVR